MNQSKTHTIRVYHKEHQLCSVMYHKQTQKPPNAPFTLFGFSVQHSPSFVLAIAIGCWLYPTLTISQVLLLFGSFTQWHPPTDKNLAERLEMCSWKLSCASRGMATGTLAGFWPFPCVFDLGPTQNRRTGANQYKKCVQHPQSRGAAQQLYHTHGIKSHFLPHDARSARSVRPLAAPPLARATSP